MHGATHADPKTLEGTCAESHAPFAPPRARAAPQLANEGAGAFYAGIGVKTAHSVLQSFVYFYAFATLRSAAEARAGGRLGVAATLLVGTLAGWCNVLLTEPLDTLATTRQARRCAAAQQHAPKQRARVCHHCSLADSCVVCAFARRADGAPQRRRAQQQQ